MRSLHVASLLAKEGPVPVHPFPHCLCCCLTVTPSDDSHQTPMQPCCTAPYSSAQPVELASSCLQVCEEHGCFEEADPSKVSDRAKKRSLLQLGSLGSGNHYTEIQVA
jgi:hypothetical protein